MFGSDICTCRPYLIYGIEEAVKEAQKGGSGVVIYFRKEGRALGEVTKVSFIQASADSHILDLCIRLAPTRTQKQISYVSSSGIQHSLIHIFPPPSPISDHTCTFP